MYRGKIMLAAFAVFAIGAAFAGTNGVIAAYETNAFPLAPPQ
jgi:hypothetical protein